MKKKDNYYIYLVKCCDNTLYCGYTSDLERRVAEHNSGRGAKYTSSRIPVQLVYWEGFETRREAMQREYAIKQLTRLQKQALILEKAKEGV